MAKSFSLYKGCIGAITFVVCTGYFLGILPGCTAQKACFRLKWPFLCHSLHNVSLVPTICMCCPYFDFSPSTSVLPFFLRKSCNIENKTCKTVGQIITEIWTASFPTKFTSKRVTRNNGVNMVDQCKEYVMIIWIVEFPKEGYKLRRAFG